MSGTCSTENPSSSPSIKWLLNKRHAVCLADEVVVKAIFNSRAATKDPLKLKKEGPALKEFYPYRVDDEGLSVIHEDKRSLEDIAKLSASINTRPLKLLAYCAINSISNSEIEFEVGRDDVGYRGHTEIGRFPANDVTERLRIASILCKAFREEERLELPPEV